MKDPKLGYHWIWFVPVASVYFVVASVYTKYEKLKHKRQIQKILKDNPDVNELSKLSGI